MIDSNHNEFAGATPVSESSANWNWLKDRVQLAALDSLDTWIAEDLLQVEAIYDDWITTKSRQVALHKELREGRS